MFFFFDPSAFGAKLETLAADLLRELGFEVFIQEGNPDQQIRRRYFDIEAKKNGKTFAVEIKGSTSPEYPNLKKIEPAICNLVNLAKTNRMISVLMIFSFVPESDKRMFRDKYNLLILDLSNILFLANHTDLYDRIIAELPFTVDGFEFEPVSSETLELGNPEAEKDKNEASEKTTYYLPIDLSGCKEGNEGSREFEELCSKALKCVFSDDLALWKKHPSSNKSIYQSSDKSLYQFDMLCRIKDNNKKTFWNIVEKYFNSKYVVFEYKNYSEAITQMQVYTTEKYLYNKALRNVAIIIARNGNDMNSEWAAKGCLRENGKLIMLLSIEDLNKMIELWNNHGDPSIVLLEKLDALLIELEK